MIIINEINVNKSSTFKKIVMRNNNVEITEDVQIKGIKLKTESRKQLYFLIYDSNYDVNRESFEYLNYYLEESSVNTREQSYIALKYLFLFCRLFNLDYKKLSEKHMKELIFFLKGDSIIGVNIELTLITQRNSNTINLYLGVYRKFYQFLKIDIDVLFNTEKPSINKKYSVFIAGKSNKLAKHKVSLKAITKLRTVPKYIRENEFKKILSIIRKEFTDRDEIIVRLMFECGLRIGEVLGLTLEDINFHINSISNFRNNVELGEIIIRNRVSDNYDQLAKNRLIPTALDTNKNIDVQVVKTSIELLLKINAYIEKSHGRMSKVKRKNYLTLAKADKLSSSNSLESEENYYIFLNKNGGPLRQSGWNYQLRKIFSKANLSIDKKCRINNLNHRFRHGFAMYLKNNLNANHLDLVGALRHKNTNTVNLYFNPTEQELYESNVRTISNIYNVIPELKEKTDDK